MDAERQLARASSRPAARSATPSYMFASSASIRASTARTASGSVAPARGCQDADRREREAHRVRRQTRPSSRSRRRPNSRALRPYFRYDNAPLAASIVEGGTRPIGYARRLRSPVADGERVTLAYLYLPIHAARPLQLIHFLPGTGVEVGMMGLQSNMEATSAPPSAPAARCSASPCAAIGSAAWPTVPPGPAGTPEFRDQIVELDHRSSSRPRLPGTRPDVDHDRMAFVGMSSGARTGITLAAIEPRYRSVFFQGAGVARRSDVGGRHQSDRVSPRISRRRRCCSRAATTKRSGSRRVPSR